MKKILLLSIALVAFLLPTTANAQLQKGNWIVGGSIANAKIEGSSFILDLHPSAGYFIMDNLAIGGCPGVTIAKLGKGSDVSFGLSLAAFGRYYFNNELTKLITKKGKFYTEAKLSGIGSNSVSGLGIGLGAGYTYFISPNVGIDLGAGISGTLGNGFHAGLDLNLGFQIYIPTSSVKRIIKR